MARKHLIEERKTAGGDLPGTDEESLARRRDTPLLISEELEQCASNRLGAFAKVHSALAHPKQRSLRNLPGIYGAV